MDQIANLVIDLSIDSAEFRNEVPRIKKLLNDAAGDSERSAARMQRFLDKQTEATRRTSASLDQVTASSTAYSSAVEKSAAASTRLAADVDQTRQRVEALGRKLREEQAQSAAVAAAQDRTSAAFYRQIDSVKQLSGGLQELQRIQARYDRRKDAEISHRAIIWRWCLKPPGRPVSLPMPKRWPRRKKHSLYAA